MKLTTIFFGLMFASHMFSQTAIIVKDVDIDCQALQKDGPPTSEEEFMNSMFYTNATVKVSGEILYLGRVTNPINNKTTPVIKKISDGKFVTVPIDFNGYNPIDGQSFRDAVSLNDQSFVVAADNGLFKFKKNNNGYVLERVIQYEGENSIYFTKIVDLGQGRCAAVGYDSLNYEFRDVPVLEYENVSSTEYQKWRKQQIEIGNDDTDYNSYYREKKEKPFKTNGYLVIWDYNTVNASSFLMNDNISDETILKTNQDGNLLVSLVTEQIEVNHLSGTSYKSKADFLYLLDIEKTIEQNDIVSVWSIQLKVGEEYFTDYGFAVTDLIEEPNGDIIFVGIQKNINQHYHSNQNLNIYTTALCIGRVTKAGDFELLNSATSINLSSWGGSDKGSLESKLMPGMIYFGNVGKPKLLHSSTLDGYIIIHRGAFDQITYPNNNNYRNSDHVVAADSPMFMYINKKNLTIESFDIMNTSIYSGADGTSSYKLEKGYKRQFNAPLINTATEFVEYNENTKELKIYETNFGIVSSSYIWTCQPTITAGWTPGAMASIGTSKSNMLAAELEREQAELRAWMDAHDSDNSTAANNYSNGNNNNNNNNGQSSSSSSSESEAQLVQVYVDPKGKTVKIYWDQNGSGKTFTLTGSRRAIGNIPEGTKLSYSLGPDYIKKHHFYTVPSGKSSVSVDL